MTIKEVAALLDAKIICSDETLLQKAVLNACGSDLMSDVLAYVKDQSLLLTGLINTQVIRTAEMMDFVCVVFVRGKEPDSAMIKLAQEGGIVLLCTTHRLFTSCGILYSGGLEGGEHASE